MIDSSYYTERDCGYATPCWVWNSAEDGEYGFYYPRGTGRDGSMGAHRYSYEEYYGPVPEGLLVHHWCDNPPCVNPAHLEAVTISENARIAKTKGGFMVERKQKNFSFSTVTIDRLERLAKQAELSQTAYLEQLIKREAAKPSGTPPKEKEGQ